MIPAGMNPGRHAQLTVVEYPPCTPAEGAWDQHVVTRVHGDFSAGRDSSNIFNCSSVQQAQQQTQEVPVHLGVERLHEPARRQPVLEGLMRRPYGEACRKCRRACKVS